VVEAACRTACLGEGHSLAEDSLAEGSLEEGRSRLGLEDRMIVAGTVAARLGCSSLAPTL